MIPLHLDLIFWRKALRNVRLFIPNHLFQAARIKLMRNGKKKKEKKKKDKKQKKR